MGALVLLLGRIGPVLRGIALGLMKGELLSAREAWVGVFAPCEGTSCSSELKRRGGLA